MGRFWPFSCSDCPSPTASHFSIDPTAPYASSLPQPSRTSDLECPSLHPAKCPGARHRPMWPVARLDVKDQRLGMLQHDYPLPPLPRSLRTPPPNVPHPCLGRKGPAPWNAFAWTYLAPAYHPKTQSTPTALPRLPWLATTHARSHPAPPPHVPRSCLGHQGPAAWNASAPDPVPSKNPIDAHRGTRVPQGQWRPPFSLFQMGVLRVALGR